MKQIAIIAKNKETYFIKRLMEEVGEEVSLFDPWSDIEFPEAETYIVRTTGVYHSDLDLLMLKAVSPEKVVNPLSALKLFRDKKTQLSWFEEENIPCPAWISLSGQSDVTVEKFFRLYPFCVVKPVIGQGGWGIELLTWEQFKSWKKKKGKDDAWILQAYIRDAKEFRVFFVKGHESIVLERKATTGVSANFKAQGDAKLSTLPEDASKIINQLILKSQATFGAIDLLIRDGELLILELNTVPGIEQIEKVSGENVMRKIIKACNPNSFA